MAALPCTPPTKPAVFGQTQHYSDTQIPYSPDLALVPIHNFWFLDMREFILLTQCHSA